MDRFTVAVGQEHFQEAEERIRGLSIMSNLSAEVVDETVSVFEEIYLRLIDGNCAEGGLTVSARRSLHTVFLELDFEGDRFLIDYEAGTQEDPGLALLQEYREKIGLTYRRGINTVSIIVKRNSNFISTASLIGLVAAVPAYALLKLFNGPEELTALNEGVVFPTLMLFFRAMMMVSAPVTFFSFISNVTGCVTLRDRRVNLRGLIGKILVSSLGAMAVAYLVHSVFYPLFSGKPGYSVIGSEILRETFEDTLLNLVPSDIFNAFTIMSPFPLILLAILNVVAICSMDRYFDSVYNIVRAITDLFCKLLSVIIFFLPVASFLSILCILLANGYRTLRFIAYYVVTVSIGSVLIILLYMLILRHGGLNAPEFMKKSRASVREILNINSTIDSVPYLTRYLSRNMKLNRSLLRQELPILSQLNLDGNCFVLMLVSLSCLSFAGHSLSIFQVLILTLIILVLSAGAPNQPGSMITGLLIVFYYVDMPIDNFPALVYMEVLFSGIILILNTLGDMVIVATGQSESEAENARNTPSQ